MFGESSRSSEEGSCEEREEAGALGWESVMKSVRREGRGLEGLMGLKKFPTERMDSPEGGSPRPKGA